MSDSEANMGVAVIRVAVVCAADHSLSFVRPTAVVHCVNHSHPGGTAT